MNKQHEYNPDLPKWLNYMVAINNTKDIDPTYEVFKGLIPLVGESTVKKMLVSMLMFYDTGVACQLTETPDDQYWAKVDEIYPTAKRGKARRHFRGENGRKSIESIKKFWTPEQFWDAMYADNYTKIRKNFDPVSGFGDYFIWKYADFCDRVFDTPVDMSSAVQYLPKEPRRGAKIIAEEMGLSNPDDFDATIKYCLDECEKIGLKASPSFDRPISVLEIETCYCGYKHLVEGDDWAGSDLDKVHDSLNGIPGRLADAMRKLAPARVPKNYFQVPGKKTDKVTQKVESAFDLFTF